MEFEIRGICKKYKEKTVVNNINIKMENGIYGLLGENGAGKTTLMRILCDIQKANCGNVLYNGEEIEKLGEDYRNILGYLPQHFGFYPDFTVYKYLMYIATLKGLKANIAQNKTIELLQMVDLLDKKDVKMNMLSGGMKQRVGIVQAMLNDPKVLILDEPTSGLDPKERVKFRNLISSFSKDKIVILSTHIVTDIEYISDEILVMKQGKLIHTGKPNEILKEVKEYVWECEIENKDIDVFSKKYNIANLRSNASKTILRIVSKEKPTTNAVYVEPTLEDLYLYYFTSEEVKQ